MFEDPVGAGGGGGQAGGDAVACGADAVFEVEINFGDDAGYVDALVVWFGELASGGWVSLRHGVLTAYAATVVCRCYEVGEFVLGDCAFTDGTLPC